ncbi:hypothetical protein DX873_10415 [Flagellimonas nanhaiensis]|uniref:Uncharacterized protein n=1 Tax=Flagellimonas nanhaiensis TaxID=2292706 RepID=A0A371JQI4_9FLAO|nr:hypothetical protein DX873_10415 [Allomuricauda nanhaiensis]
MSSYKHYLLYDPKVELETGQNCAILAGMFYNRSLIIMCLALKLGWQKTIDHLRKIQRWFLNKRINSAIF